MMPKGPEQQGKADGSYVMVVAVVLGVAVGIALASVTGEGYFIMGGLAAGAVVALWLARRR
jgi:hypothetical protein